MQDYYAFGMQMPGRKWSGGYRYGFNGKENDNEVKGEGWFQDYGMRSYDPLTGRFNSVDPLTGNYPYYSPYQFAGNNPIGFIDLDGLEPAEPGSKVGERQAGTNGNSDVAKTWEWNGKSWIEATLETVTVIGTRKKAAATGDKKEGSNFAKYQKRVFDHEGGYGNDPADPGGPTNKGIIISNFKQWAQKDLGIEPTLDNLKGLTNDQAAILYKKHYWDRIRGDEFKNGSIAFAIYDWSVTSGGAVKELEKLFSVMTSGISVDSKFNSSEIAAKNKVNAKQVFEKIKERRLSYYQGLIDRSVEKYKEKHHDATDKDLKKHTLLRFKEGWKNRVNDIKFE